LGGAEGAQTLSTVKDDLSVTKAQFALLPGPDIYTSCHSPCGIATRCCAVKHMHCLGPSGKLSHTFTQDRNVPLPGLRSALGAKRASLCSLDGADSNFCPFLLLTMSEAAKKSGSGDWNRLLTALSVVWHPVSHSATPRYAQQGSNDQRWWSCPSAPQRRRRSSMMEREPTPPRLGATLVATPGNPPPPTRPRPAGRSPHSSLSAKSWRLIWR